jgi:uncharacterized tellurite resistance protein B-like protein
MAGSGTEVARHGPPRPRAPTTPPDRDRRGRAAGLTLFGRCALRYGCGMIDLVRRLLASPPEPMAAADSRLALAALMVRVARADSVYEGPEAARIDRILALRHGLGPAEAAALRFAAERVEAAAPDTVRFTRALKDAVPIEERQGLVEALWSVALADGARDAQEDRLLRLVAHLLGLTDVESAQARQRAERRG